LAGIDFLGFPVTFRYSVREDCFSPKKISINGTAIEFTYEDNIYRKGGAVIPSNLFLSLLNKQENLVEVEL
jgi:hypothetical protein